MKHLLINRDFDLILFMHELAKKTIRLITKEDIKLLEKNCMLWLGPSNKSRISVERFQEINH